MVHFVGLVDHKTAFMPGRFRDDPLLVFLSLRIHTKITYNVHRKLIFKIFSNHFFFLYSLGTRYPRFPRALISGITASSVLVTRFPVAAATILKMVGMFELLRTVFRSPH